MPPWNEVMYRLFLGLLIAMSANAASAQTTAPDVASYHASIARGDEAFDKGEFDDADWSYQRALTRANNPSAKVRALRSLARVRQHFWDLQQAIGYLETAHAIVEQTPEMARGERYDLIDHLSRIYFDAGKYEQLQQLSSRSIDDLESDRRRAITFFGQSLLHGGRIEQAAEVFRICLVEADHRGDTAAAAAALTWLSYAAMADGNVDEALQRANQRIDRFPDQDFSHLARGYVHILRRDWEAAAANIRQGMDIRISDDGILLLWITTARKGNVGEADERFRRDVARTGLKGPYKALAEWILAGHQGEPLFGSIISPRFDLQGYAYACFMAGEVMLLDDRPDDARRFFQECTKASHPGFVGHILATAALQRLAAEKGKD